MKKVGIISDTHGLLRPEILGILKGCDCIIHAGDVNKPEILGRYSIQIQRQTAANTQRTGLLREVL